jgi:hypothetical protein
MQYLYFHVMVLQGPEVPWAPASALATAPTGGRLSTVTVRHTVRPAQRTREQVSMGIGWEMDL